ncbi:MAG: glycosyltransferase family 2 protein [Bacteroidales bacterium]|nr:glycosyltransferase family 2 protein [Bacteroidales bacterium]
MDLSIIISLYNEEESIKELYSWIETSLAKENISYEVIFVNDGSTDHSWRIIQEIANSHSNVRGISFRRNYGKSAALYCGFEAAEGDIVVTMDADLQDSPDEIPEMMRIIKENGYDLVSGWKKKRYDNAITKNIPSKLYNWTARKVTGIKLHDMNCGLKAYRKEVVKSIEVYGEMHRFIPYLAKNAGYDKITEKVVKHQARKYGKSKFGIDRFLHGFLDLMTIYFLQKFGRKPMHFFGLMGSFTFLTGFLLAIGIIIDKLVRQGHNMPFRPVTDRPLFYLALVALLIGTQLFLTGFIGELISRNSDNRNNYDIKERIG